MAGNNMDQKIKNNEQERLMEVDSVLFKYPKTKVISAYLLLGGAVGGLLVMMCSLAVVEGHYFGSFSDVIFFLSFDAIFGTIPALFTGLVVASSEIVIKNIFSYVLVGAIGFFVTSFCFSIVLREFRLFHWVGFLGCVSAIILAFCFVPKESKTDV